jgi:hypothetical protein
LPDLATWAGRKIIIRKISSAVGTVTIQRAGSNVITRAGLTSVDLVSEGDHWEFFAGSAKWELLTGKETGTGYTRYANGEMIQEDATGTLGGSTTQTATPITFPKQFASIETIMGSALRVINSNYVTVDFLSLTIAGVTLIGYSPTAAQTYQIHWRAKGRWYA